MKFPSRITTNLLIIVIIVGSNLPVQAQPAARRTSSGRRPNVLFIAVDDLRPELGVFGVSLSKTPHIDRLANQGTLFTRAYCQQAVCSPSRTSLLTGRRPDTTRIYDLQTHFRSTIPDVVTLPQHFKQHGYFTQSLSKIYHGGLDDPQSWSVPSWRPSAPPYGKPETLVDLQKQRERLRAEGLETEDRIVQRDEKTGTTLMLANPQQRARGPAWEDPDVVDNALPDGQTADKAIEVMRQVKDKPFFLAVGFLKPHLPFVAPKRYFDLHPRDKFRLPPDYFPPRDAPPFATTNFGELRSYKDMPKGDAPLSDEQALELIRAYYAATSYTDAQIGRLLAELDRLGLRDNTIVVLWGDHGWHLGNHGMWTKHTNFEIATRAPLIINAPQQRHLKTDALVEFVDVYPTLVELAGLPVPAGLEGASLAGLIRGSKTAWKTAVFSQYPRGGGVMGYTMRTDRYRYTEWTRANSEVQAVELYDHQRDAQENFNIAGKAENKGLVAELSKKLRAGWQAAAPSALTKSAPRR